MDGLLANVFSLGDTLKRRVRGLLSDPLHQMQANANAWAGDTLQAMQTPEGMATGLLGMAPIGMAGIVSPAAAKRSGVAVNLPNSAEFRSAVSATPGASITEDGLLMRIARNQQPEQALQPSVRGGVFYLPEGSANMKHYSTPRNSYGGSEKIRGETLVRNPLFVKGATGGKAPEAAYDSLIGKGAYQKMREDALHWSGGPADIREEAITKFLEKYAPEMSDQAWYILQNSKRGNQLAYALQEAAVGSATRKAGHDAVLGYSKGRAGKGEFLSELFDVREQAYPDKFGTFRLWDQFDSK